VLADASAVQFTREPMALADALKKIGGFTPYLSATEGEEVSHMMFGRAAASFRGWFATHPPLPDRIRALDPTFDGQYIASEVVHAAADDGDPAAHGTAAHGTAIAGFTGGSAGVTVAAAGTVRDDGTAQSLLDSVPAALREAAHSPTDAILLVVGVALAGNADDDRQLTAILDARLGRQRRDIAFDLARQLTATDRRLWLPIVETAVPALRRRPAGEIDFMFDLLHRLIESDARQTLFEYVLLVLLRAYLSPPGRAAGKRQLREAWIHCLATIARIGSRDLQSMRSALQAGLAVIPGGAATDDADALLAGAGLDVLDR